MDPGHKARDDNRIGVGTTSIGSIRPVNTTLLLQLIVNGVIVGALYGVVAMCFVLIYKASQVVNFAQGEFVLIGAWACW